MNQVKIISKKGIEYYILFIIGALSIIGMFTMPPINQSQAYHKFVDVDTFFNIPNFLNVISNIPFLIVGILGLYRLDLIAKVKIQYLIFFLGIVFVSIGSSYYHLNPNDNTLIWDRLPMTIVFMSLMSIIISEFISNRKGLLLLFPMLLVGLLSILYWIIFNDLKFYVLIQFYPMLLIPAILVFYKSKYNKIFGYWLLLITYLIAKFLEHFDIQIFNALGVISGHSLKHLISAIGIFILYWTYMKRDKIVINNNSKS